MQKKSLSKHKGTKKVSKYEKSFVILQKYFNYLRCDI